MICPYCTLRDIPEGKITCGDSLCQEADYYSRMGLHRMVTAVGRIQ